MCGAQKVSSNMCGAQRWMTTLGSGGLATARTTEIPTLVVVEVVAP